MTAPISLAAKRWDSGNGRPGSHSIRDMLEVILAKLDSGELQAQHALFLWGVESDGVGDDGFFQAGSFGPYAQIGLVERALTLLKEGN